MKNLDACPIADPCPQGHARQRAEDASAVLVIRILHVLAMALFVGGQRLVWLHIRRPGAHALEGAVFVVSLVIVWLGLALAHGPLPF